MGLLDGKTAIVTGAARGIGKAIALKFASEGANIAFTDLVIDENAENTAKEIEAMGVKAKGYASNAANFEDTAKVVEAIHADFGRIDILVNNAGITRDGLMMRMSEQQWDMVINVNLKSAFNFVHACTPIMMRQKAGSIINMASVVGVHGNAGQANYAASKAGMIALAKSIAQELGSRGIRANAIAPGFILVPLLIAGLVGRYVFKLNYYTLIGVLGGSTTNPPALAYSNDLTSCDAPAVGYATVYPLTMFLRVLTAQILILALA